MPDEPVLVAVDFSPDSERAFEYSIGVARRLGAELVHFHAWDPRGWTTEFGETPEETAFVYSGRQATATLLETWAECARAEGLTARTQLADGPAPQKLAEFAQEQRPTLVVVGRRGAAQPVHVALGSVAERAVRLVDRPVLVVPRDAPPLTEIDRVVVGIDYSACSEEAFAVAARFARAMGARNGLLAIHAFPGEFDPWLSARKMDPTSHSHAEIEQARLEQWVEARSVDGVVCEAQAIFGHADDRLIDAAESEAHAWIAVGMQGLSTWAPFGVGATTERVLKRTEWPVLTVCPSKPPLWEPPD